jgi:hypothetical protein
MVHTVTYGNSVTIKLFAKDFYSRDSFEVQAGMRYLLICDGNQTWNDWFVTSSPSGYNNLLAKLFGLRLKTAKCFCLCGVFDKIEGTSFRIGSSFHIEPQATTKILSFYANDYKKAYWNNHGSIDITITSV